LQEKGGARLRDVTHSRPSKADGNKTERSRQVGALTGLVPKLIHAGK
jgi:hypothetical protein